MSIKREGSYLRTGAIRVRKYIASLAIAGAAAAALASVALATPASTNVVGTVVARAGFADSVDIRLKVTDPSRLHGRHGEDRDERKGEQRDRGDDHTTVINVRQARDTVMQQILLGPGGHTGWHSHPGPAIALIKRGELTLYSSDDPTCTGRPFGVGQAFVDSGQGHVHMARNLTNQDTEVWVTYLDVPPGGSPRIDAADPPNCVF